MLPRLTLSPLECWEGISPDLQRVHGFQARRAPTKDDSCFFQALADTEPDAWGRRVIARAHARERKDNGALGPLTELDYLCAVDDFSRIGALRLYDAKRGYLRTTEEGKRATPPLLELERILTASRAVELSNESAADLNYLQGTVANGSQNAWPIVSSCQPHHCAVVPRPHTRLMESMTAIVVAALSPAATSSNSVS